MTAPPPPPIRPGHRHLLTRAELEVVTLYEQGWGYRSIARYLCISTSAVRDRLERAAARIANHHPEAS